MIFSWLGFLLLPIAATCGWYIGRNESLPNSSVQNLQLHQDYFKGLNYLIDEQPDKAVDVFVKLLEVDSDTVEMHLALGNLFRRRGEVDRAIRIHQNLIARPQLDKAYKMQALADLGQDYLRAGVLDRAERLFQELIADGGANEQNCRFLLHIYQQEKDWLNAIQVAEKLSEFLNESTQPIIAHYHCEIAEQEIASGEFQAAIKTLNLAYQYHPNCVRASLIRGQLALRMKQYREAISYYQQVVQQDADYISEIVEPLSFCYRSLNAENEWIMYFQKLLHLHPRTALVIAISNHLQDPINHNKQSIEFVATQMKHKPSLRGLSHLVGLYLPNFYGDTQDKLLLLQDFIQKLLADKPTYRCLRCGFSGKTLFWLCPGCHSWATIKPIQGLEGL